MYLQETSDMVFSPFSTPVRSQIEIVGKNTSRKKKKKERKQNFPFGNEMKCTIAPGKRERVIIGVVVTYHKP